ncbi:hypothetical protein ACWGDT_44190 [Streptomyces avermitilis]
MARNTAATVKTREGGRRIDLYQALRSAIRRNTVEALSGAPPAADSHMIGARLQLALDSTDLPLGMQFFLTGIPNPMTARARRARRQVAARVQAEIGRRRARGRAQREREAARPREATGWGCCGPPGTPRGAAWATANSRTR